MPAVFALADKVIGQPQTSIFAAFGSFALLVLVEFGGPPRTRLLAYLGLACVGAAFITLGTLCSRDPWLPPPSEAPRAESTPSVRAHASPLLHVPGPAASAVL